MFCFIDGNPEGVRQSLWLRDDDFRLSFTYGSYVTLTNLGPKGLQRLVDQRISPPLRERARHRARGAASACWSTSAPGSSWTSLRLLLDGGLEVHTQVVLCPEWNDGAHLDRTIEDLWGLGEGIRSLSVVPVGLTRYNLDRPVRLLARRRGPRGHRREVDRARARAVAERDFGWCYAADEMYLIAGEPLPEAGYYDDGALYENGVGAVRRFVDGFDEGLGERAPPRRTPHPPGDRPLHGALPARAGGAARPSHRRRRSRWWRS